MELDLAAMPVASLADYATSTEFVDAVRAAGRLDELVGWLAKRPALDSRLAYRIQCIGPEARACVSGLLRVFERDDGYDARSAAHALVAIAPGDRRVLAALRACRSRGRHPKHLTAALVAYVELDPALADELLSEVVGSYDGHDVLDGIEYHGVRPALAAAIARTARTPAGLAVAARVAGACKVGFPSDIVARALASPDAETRGAAVSAVLARAADTAAAATFLPAIALSELSPGDRYRVLERVAGSCLDDVTREELLATGARLPVDGSIDALLARSPRLAALEADDRDAALAAARTAPIAYLGAYALRLYGSTEVAQGLAIVRDAGRIAELAAWLAARPIDRESAELIAEIGPDAAACAPALGRALASDDDDDVRRACAALVAIRAIDAAGIAQVRRILATASADGDGVRAVARALPGLAAAAPTLVDDVVASIADDRLCDLVCDGLARYGATPALAVRLARDEPLALRASRGLRDTFPAALVARAAASGDPAGRALAYDAILARARDTPAAAALLAPLFLDAPPGDPIRERALRVASDVALDDATRARIYDAARADPRLAPIAVVCLPPGCHRGASRTVSADGRFGAAFDCTSDRTSYRESDTTYEVVVFELAFPYRIVERRHYSVFENASGRRGSAPSRLAFVDERTLEVHLDDGTTDALHFEAPRRHP